jgi:microcystin-dependent protein
MADAFVGEIRAVAFGFTPTGWTPCIGQVLPWRQHTALFSVIGTFYGGDGNVTFALPDLRGAVAIGAGQGPGLSNYALGASGGQAAVTLTADNLPAHTHTARGSSANGNRTTPAGGSWAADASGRTMDYQSAAPDGSMQANAMGTAGGNAAHNNRQPYQAVQYLICMAGIFPSRS